MTHNIMKMTLHNGKWKDEYLIFDEPVSEDVAHKTAQSLIRAAARRPGTHYIVVRAKQ